MRTGIAGSLKAFPDRRQLRKLLLESGFVPTRSRHFFLGLLELVVLRKRPASSGREAASAPGP